MVTQAVHLRNVASYLNVSNERARQLHKASRLPPPIATKGRRAVWEGDDIEEWANRKWWGTRPWRQRVGRRA